MARCEFYCSDCNWSNITNVTNTSYSECPECGGSVLSFFDKKRDHNEDYRDYEYYDEGCIEDEEGN